VDNGRFHAEEKDKEKNKKKIVKTVERKYFHEKFLCKCGKSK
jgi:CDGSH-type Zn-finger protein